MHVYMRIALALQIALWIAPFAAQAEDPFSFVDPVVRIPAGTQDGTGEVSLRSSVTQTSSPALQDKNLDLPLPYAARVLFDPIKEGNPPPNVWRYRVSIYGLNSSGVSQQHYAIVTYGDKKTQTIPYTVTNLPATALSWSISKLPDPWVASGWYADDAHCSMVSVTTKESPANDVKLYSTLVEGTTKKAVVLGDLQICPHGRGSGCDSRQPINLPANTTSDLRFCTTATPLHGSYHGNLVLAARQKPDGDAILQNAQFSSFPAKLAGFLAILAGAFLAWLSKVFSRARLERDQALMPAVFMRSQLARLQQSLAQMRPPYRTAASDLNGEIENLLARISDDTLDSKHFLPPKFPSPYGYTVETSGYKAYLETLNPGVQTFSVLVNKGVIPAGAEDQGNLSSAQQALVAEAIKKISMIAGETPLPSAEQAFPRVNAIVTKLHDDLFPKPQGMAAPPPAPVPSLVHAFEILQVEITSISKWIWLIYGLLTALTGLGFLILNNPGYGIPSDFLLAFFWGFGLPTTIQALAPGSAATALGISIAHA